MVSIQHLLHSNNGKFESIQKMLSIQSKLAFCRLKMNWFHKLILKLCNYCTQFLFTYIMKSSIESFLINSHINESFSHLRSSIIFSSASFKYSKHLICTSSPQRLIKHLHHHSQRSHLERIIKMFWVINRIENHPNINNFKHYDFLVLMVQNSQILKFVKLILNKINFFMVKVNNMHSQWLNPNKIS